MKIILIIILTCFGVRLANANDDRIWCSNVKINGQPVRIIFDSGSDTPITLFSASAARLSLKVLPPDLNSPLKPGRIRVGHTETNNLDIGIGTTNFQTEMDVIEIPPYFKGIDGMFGWPLIRSNILQIDAAKNAVGLLQNAPDDPSWMKFRIETNLNVLGFEVIDKRGKRMTVIVDTGNQNGISLVPEMWSEWKALHTNEPVTPDAFYMPGAGLVVREESWAHEISLGSLMLTDVPIREANLSEVAIDPDFKASLGLAALKRLDIITDVKNGIAYLRPKMTPPLPYEHNRIGVVFVPRDIQNHDLIAHVVNGSPAFEAGIRNDDVLLKIGELDATKWQTDPNVLPLSRFWNSPAGTKLELTMKRGDKVLKATVVLRNILPPDIPK